MVASPRNPSNLLRLRHRTCWWLACLGYCQTSSLVCEGHLEKARMWAEADIEEHLGCTDLHRLRAGFSALDSCPVRRPSHPGALAVQQVREMRRRRGAQTSLPSDDWICLSVPSTMLTLLDLCSTREAFANTSLVTCRNGSVSARVH